MFLQKGQDFLFHQSYSIVIQLSLFLFQSRDFPPHPREFLQVLLRVPVSPGRSWRVLHPAQRTLVHLVTHPAAGADDVLLLAHVDGDLGDLQTHGALQLFLLVVD